MFEKYSDSFLNNFNFDSLLEKFTNKKFLTFKEGEIIFCENSYIAEIYFILSGEVNLTKIKMILIIVSVQPLIPVTYLDFMMLLPVMNIPAMQ
ncbi:MAG: hypothetical protein IPP52_04425 [Ignavibacteria bacterium]|nr:hypothetical protein [Ignavibacteria bacterium]